MEKMDVAHMEKKFLTCREVCQEYCGSPILWRRLALKHKIPAHRCGEVIIVFRREDVEKYLDSQLVDGPAECRNGHRNGRKPGRKPKYDRSNN